MTEKPNFTREREVREVMERDTLGASFVIAIAVLALVIAIAAWGVG